MKMVQPWYQRTLRWGQANLSEQDPLSYDAAWWREYWQKTQVQGVIINAGGIVAYYPSQFELHERATFLGDRDLFGEICRAARADGLTVLARMDSNRASKRFYQAHPDWFCLDQEGKPAVAGKRHIACLNSPYTREYLPAVLREVIARYHPDGITDNSWSGSGKEMICHCAYCQAKFLTQTGLGLPNRVNWDDPVYRTWVRWSYDCRLEVWDLNNQVAREAGGEDCLWMGMVNGNPFATHLSFCDLKRVGERAKILMSDQQGRDQAGFEQNSQSGKLLHDLLGWENLIPESMAHYVRGEQAFRKAAAPVLETQQWLVSGLAGGISPWWHHVGAKQEDRRQFSTSRSLFEWHAANQDVLYDRLPVASVGLVWSHENNDFFGREQTELRVYEPWRGISRALLQARLPYLPVHADYIERDALKFGLRLLILPNLAILSPAQTEQVVRFVEAGGSVLASSASSLYSEDGEVRSEFGLSALFGIRCLGEVVGAHVDEENWEVYAGHTYLRLPGKGQERHLLLSGFEDTDILAFGGVLQAIDPLPGSQVVATFIPAFPIYPPEISWMRTAETQRAAIVVRDHPAGGRLVYFAANIDRCYGRRGLPDHGMLLENAIRWALADEAVVSVRGSGVIDCSLYRQGNRLILHLVNLSGCNYDGYAQECLAVGPLQISLPWPQQQAARRAVCRVSGVSLDPASAMGQVELVLARLAQHEVIVIE